MSLESNFSEQSDCRQNDLPFASCVNVVGAKSDILRITYMIVLDLFGVK